MKYLLNSQEMKAADSRTIHQFGMPSMVLMERAALGVVELIKARGLTGASFGIVCGTGNNGGDGLAVARLLWEAGCRVCYLVLGDESRGTPEFLKQLQMVKAYEIRRADTVDELRSCDVYIDAIFGVGLSREIQGDYRLAIEKLEAMEGHKIAVDIPSGISSDDGRVLGIALHCQDTVTFAFGKIGCFLDPGRAYCGQVHIADIGITKNSLADDKPACVCLEDTDLCMLPERARDAHKGNCGKILVIAGSEGMSGAAYFAGRAAYLGGSGLVRILTPECNRSILQSLIPEAVILAYRDEPEEEALLSAMQWADVILMGPGLGISESARRIVRIVLEKAAVPLVCDADALNILSEDLTLLEGIRSEVVLTPHLGEMSRLSKESISEICEHKLEAARVFANRCHVICVLKDSASMTAVPDSYTYVNDSGNPGMATAGSGDVLSGLIAGLIGQGLPAAHAAGLGVYVHGLAGDEAASEKGILSMTATDILEGIPRVLKKRGR